jgi:hypothetical protein
MKIKTCKICGDTSDRVLFYQNLNKCRTCALGEASEYNKKRNQDPEYIKARRIRWNKWRAANKDKIKRNPDMEKISKQSSPRRFLTDKMAHAKRVCKKKNIKFDIDLNFLEQLWDEQNGRCALTGVRMSYQNGDLLSVRLNLIEEEEGYTKDNVQLICDGANRLKKSGTNVDVIRFLQEVKSVIMIRHNKYRF